MGECFFWYRPTWVVPDQRPLNGRCCCCQVCIYQITLHLSSSALTYKFSSNTTKLNWTSAFPYKVLKISLVNLQRCIIIVTYSNILHLTLQSSCESECCSPKPGCVDPHPLDHNVRDIGRYCSLPLAVIDL